MTTHIVTMSEDAPLPSGWKSALVPSLVDHVLQSEGVADIWEVGIQFVDDATMQLAHVEFMDIDEPTDIMTFPYEDDDDAWGESTPGGDLMISVDRAAANAVEAGWSSVSELQFLVVHGLLHLAGWDDHSPQEREAMLARQHELLVSWQR